MVVKTKDCALFGINSILGFEPMLKFDKISGINKLYLTTKVSFDIEGRGESYTEITGPGLPRSLRKDYECDKSILEGVTVAIAGHERVKKNILSLVNNNLELDASVLG